jgi:hypothetical protein
MLRVHRRDQPERRIDGRARQLAPGLANRVALCERDAIEPFRQPDRPLDPSVEVARLRVPP